MSKILCVLDGFGLTSPSSSNAIYLAKMPNFRYLLKNYYFSSLDADGQNVGQEGGLVGNSEVGHMNLGGLKLVPQLSFQITNSSQKAFDLDKKIAPDQNFDPKEFLIKNWNLTIQDLRKMKNEISDLVIQAFENVQKNGPKWRTGITIDDLNESNFLVSDFFENLINWFTLSDLSLETLKEIVATGFEPDYFNPVFKNLLQAYILSNSRHEHELLSFLNQKSKIIHLVGLFSTGTIHSDLRHWAGSIQAAGLAGAQKIVLHILSDGRDSDRQSLVATWNYFIDKYTDQLKPFEDKIFLGSVGGRFYAMDRDNNWDRVLNGNISILTGAVYDVGKNNKLEETNKDSHILIKEFVEKYYGKEFFEKFILDFNKLNEARNEITNFIEEYKDEKASEMKTMIKNFELEKISDVLEFWTKEMYAKEIYDEYLIPILLELISKNNTVWLINFRTDRMKQFSQMLVDINKEFELDLTILGMNDYGDGAAIKWDGLSKTENNGYYPIFTSKPVQNTLAENISNQGKTQLHLAETEKYNHVTYFFNGGQNKKSEGEDWMVIPSNKVASHSEKPEMKAKEITDYLLENLDKYDYVIMNYANPDMVGHTGDLQAGIASLEALDEQLGRLISVVENGNHTLIITADHGNIEVVGEYKKDDKVLIDTEHNPNPVPLIIVQKNLELKTLVSSLEKTVKELNLDISTSDLQDQLQKINSEKKDLDIDQWLLPESVYKPTLPLHLAGVLLLSL